MELDLGGGLKAYLSPYQERVIRERLEEERRKINEMFENEEYSEISEELRKDLKPFDIKKYVIMNELCTEALDLIDKKE